MTTTHTPTATEIAEGVLERLESAWNAGDGVGYGAPYAEQASFVNVNGLVLSGAPAITDGHAGIFATIYLGSRVSYELLSAQAWSEDVIHVVSRGTLEVPGGPLAGVREAIGTHLLVRLGGEWQVASTHNTLVEA
jgi:uncharacterized protein (TIGR02246 family)